MSYIDKDSKFYQDCKKYKKSYQIGLVCMDSFNYGNSLTNYALYQYLNDLGYSVLLIYYPVLKTVNGFELFKELPYPECDVFVHDKSKWQYSYANVLCDKFVVGSDQLWRKDSVKLTNFFTCLDWVEPEKYKMAYSVSFAIDYFEGGADMRNKIGYLLRRFQNISVREIGGVKLLKELYEIEAEHVLDPVFLCEKRHYERMAEKGKERLPNGKFVGSYFLDITSEKESAVLSIANHMTGGEYLTIYGTDSPDCGDTKLQLLSDPTVEEWLAMIVNCDFFIADSFHGVCLALIFQKQFCMIFDKECLRGWSRIQSLLDLLQLNSRLVEDYTEEKILALYNEPIDYARVNAILSKECERSKKWLKDSLDQGDDYQSQHDLYDLFWKLNVRMQIAEHKTRNELFLLAHTLPRGGSIEIMSGVDENMQIVGWGAGDCFKRRISHIKRFCDMKYVCDSDPQKWGKEIKEGVICISPKTLSEMRNIVVIIMVDDVAVAFKIVRELLEMGITNFEHVENWLSYLEG